MNILFYAGSLRPGGGLTVAKIMLEALAENSVNNIKVYTGENDSSLALSTLINTHNNITEQPFFPKLNSEIRYVLSKIYFLPKTLFKRNSLLISVNYFIPVFCKQFVYHLNLLSFLTQEDDEIGQKIKRLDAKLACRFASINVFESRFLKETAMDFTKVKINNPNILYIGVDPVFYEGYEVEIKEYQLLSVSSVQPHKDNETTVRVLQELKSREPEKPWKLIIAGGQTKEQWEPLAKFANTLGIGEAIEFIGPVDKKKLTKLMKQSLCLISASKVESFCMVALEAMAARCPAIVTNETSMPESVANAAIVVEAGSIRQFVSSILKIHADQHYRQNIIMSGKERARVFSNQNFKSSLNKITENILKDN